MEGGSSFDGNAAKRVKLGRSTYSNIPSLQTSTDLDEIAHSSKLGKRHLADIEATLNPVVQCIKSIGNVPSKKVEKIIRLKETFFPSHQPSLPAAAAKRTNLAFSPPQKIEQVGDIALGSIVKHSGRKYVDIAVEMPASLFQNDDSSNGAYFHKRAFFLAAIANALTDAKLLGDSLLDFDFIDDDELRPIIVVLLPAAGSKPSNVPHSFTLRIIPVLPFEVFSALDSKSNTAEDVSIACRTSVAADRTLFTRNAFLKTCLSNQKALKAACILGNLWLESRDLNGSVSGGGFGPFEWTTLVGYLLYTSEQKKTPNTFVGPQLFKAALEFLSMKDLHKDLTVYGCNGNGEARVVGGDILFKMTKSSYDLLKHEAKLALVSFKAPRTAAAFFTKPMGGVLRQYDVSARVPHDTTPQGEPLGDGRNKSISVANRMHDLLSKALGDRARIILVTPPGKPPASARNGKTENGPKGEDVQFFRIDISLDPTNSRRLVEHGPLVGSDEAARFRSFWRDRAELRRFKNGEVRESIVWESKLPVAPQIIRWLFGEYFSGIPEGDLKISGYEFDSFVTGIPLHGSFTSPFDNLRRDFHQLERLLRDIEGLPLHFKEISPADPALRCTSVNSPLVNSSGGEPDATHDILLTFETTSRWPDDYNVVQMIKISLLAKLVKILGERSEVASAAVGLEGSAGAVANMGFVDVMFGEGYKFRLRIRADNETLLFQGSIPATKRLRNSSTPLGSEIEGSQDRHDTAEHLTHHDAMNRLVQKFEILSPTIRLVKRWFQSQLLSPHIDQECVELLCVHSFFNSPHRSPPGSPTAGLLCCLYFLANWDWKAEPCVVDFESRIPAENRENIQLRFSQARKLDPGCHKFVYFVASSTDESGFTWTKYRPSSIVAHRVTALARSAVAAVQSGYMGEKIFKPFLRDFDALVHFHKDTTQAYRNIEETMNSKGRRRGLLIDFLKELTRLFVSVLYLFYDENDPTVAAIVWNSARDTLNPISSDIKSAAEDSKKLQALDQRATLCEIKRLGHDLVSRIEVK